MSYNNGDLANFKWNQGILNKLIGMCYKKSQLITIFNLRNLQKLMQSSDFSEYENKSQIIGRIRFIIRSLEGKLDKKYNSEDIIISYATEDTDNDLVFNDIINNLPKYKQSISQSEIKYLNNMIEDRLRFGLIATKYIERMGTLFERYNDGDYRSYAEFNALMEKLVQDYNIDNRKITSEIDNGMIRFNSSNIREKVIDILDRIGTTDSVVMTGIKMLNDILYPGFRGSKLYTFAALPANFKSGMLLKVAIDCIKYNGTTYRGRKQDHSKAVLYFTMENTIDETFERIYNMNVDNQNIINYSVDHIINKLTKASIINNPDIELITVYKPNRSITTKDIQTLIEQLDEEGVEVIMLCFDYIKRIRPYEPATTEKEELKNVSNELKQIGMDFNIPIVTAAQLNRQAAAKLNEEVRSGNFDALKDIDGSTIGSAWEIMENSDVVLLIFMQMRKKDNKLFLSISCTKQRYHRPESPYFNQPFETETFNLVDDIYKEKPDGVISLKTDFVDIDIDHYSGKGRKYIDVTILDENGNAQPNTVNIIDDTFRI